MDKFTRPKAATVPALFDWTPILRSIVLDRDGGTPLHVQLRNSLRRVIQSVPAQVEKLPAENTLMPLLGVSQATVRTALDGLVDEGLIQRRRALGTVIVRQHPALAAQDSNSPGITLSRVALIVPTSAGYSNSEHIANLTAHANERGATITLISFGKGDDWQFSRARIGFGPSEGGVVLMHGFNPATVHDLYGILSGQGYRTVCVGLPPEGCACPSVGIDNRAFIEMGLKYLIQQGHRRIAFLVGEPEEHPEVIERVGYFKQLVQALDLPDAEVVHGGGTYEDSSARIASDATARLWLERPAEKRPTVFFGISDVCAAGALYALASQGVSVPEDVSLLCYDGTSLTHLLHPQLTTLATPFDQFASAVLDFLAVDSSGDSVAERPSLLIQPHLWLGQSVKEIV